MNEADTCRKCPQLSISDEMTISMYEELRTIQNCCKRHCWSVLTTW